jgi:hydrogenase maturation protease
VDAVPRGGAPGTLYVIEPEFDQAGNSAFDVPIIEMHDLDPAKVLRLARSLGGNVERVLLVGCDPERCSSDEDFSMEMSDPVKAAIEEAVPLVESLISQILSGSARNAS